MQTLTFLNRDPTQAQPPWSEDEIQMYVVMRFRQVYPAYLVHADSNGANKAKTQGARMKAMGALAGWPDLTVALPNRLVFFELKVDTDQSPNQKAIGTKLYEMGHEYYVIKASTPESAWQMVNAIVG